MGDTEKPSVFAAGYLIFRKTQRLEFLLLKHSDRWDLPKGHVDAGESFTQTAIRELWEETAIPGDAIWTDPSFTYSSIYSVPKRKNPEKREVKQLTMFLGFLLRPVEIVCTEHPTFQWFPWNPPHRIQTQAIDPLLESAAEHFRRYPELPESRLS